MPREKYRVPARYRALREMTPKMNSRPFMFAILSEQTVRTKRSQLT